MDIVEILSECEKVEKTISLLIRENSVKETELNGLQENVFEFTKVGLEDTLHKECQLQAQLNDVVTKRQDIENEIKQFANINEKLTELVTTAQKRNNQDINEETLVALVEAQEDYSHVKTSFDRAKSKLKELEDGLIQDTQEVQKLIHDNIEQLVSLGHNDNMIRLLEQQNRYSERQFDMILEEIPWEPITKQCLDELLSSPVQAIKDVATTLQVQTNEMEDLNESLRCKKRKKLATLEHLLQELGNFIKKRDEAFLVARLGN